MVMGDGPIPVSLLSAQSAAYARSARLRKYGFEGPTKVVRGRNVRRTVKPYKAVGGCS